MRTRALIRRGGYIIWGGTGTYQGLAQETAGVPGRMLAVKEEGAAGLGLPICQANLLGSSIHTVVFMRANTSAVLGYAWMVFYRRIPLFCLKACQIHRAWIFPFSGVRGYIVHCLGGILRHPGRVGREAFFVMWSASEWGMRWPTEVGRWQPQTQQQGQRLNPLAQSKKMR